MRNSPYGVTMLSCPQIQLPMRTDHSPKINPSMIPANFLLKSSIAADQLTSLIVKAFNWVAALINRYLPFFFLTRNHGTATMLQYHVLDPIVTNFHDLRNKRLRDAEVLSLPRFMQNRGYFMWRLHLITKGDFLRKIKSNRSFTVEQYLNQNLLLLRCYRLSNS